MCYYMWGDTDLLEVSLVEGTHSNVVLQGRVGGLQLECTLERVFCQLPVTQKHVHQSSVWKKMREGEENERLHRKG